MKGEVTEMMHEIILPDLGQTTSEGKVLKWRKQLGDCVSRGEPLLEIETDKVTMDVEAYAPGYLREILVTEGQMATALEPIAILTDDPVEPYERKAQEARALAFAAGSAPPTLHAETPPARKGTSAAPAARALAKELGVDVALVTGTGPGGLITRKDVERHAARPAAAAAKPASGMAALTSKSKQTIPHFYVTVDVDASAATQWREKWNESHPDLPATVNDIFVRAAAKALRAVPSLNVSYGDGQLKPHSAADILLVVAVESGLTLVPMADPSDLSWDEYLRRIRTGLDKAKQSRVMEASTRSTPLLAISNLGMAGVKQFAAIIPPSCTAALAIGAIREEAVVRQKKIQVSQVCSLTLSADHRVVDGLTAAKFLAKMQEQLNSL
jgi:pyruvate dehydrogenase E2 component (dihydrolipoamide acetyltransferase)